MPSRARTVRLLTWGLGGVALGIALVLLLVNVVARTERGHEFVLQRTLDALGKNVSGGELLIERIDGNLFEGAKVYGLRLQDKQGRAFLVADSAFLDYRVTTLLSPRIHITRATLYEPEVYIFKLPGDTLWNYQAIFARSGPRDTTRARVERVTLVDTLRMVNGTVRVQTPWSPDSTLPPRQRRAAVEEALSDTSLALIDSVQGGFLRTMNFTRLTGRITQVRFGPGTQSGSRVRVDSLRGTLQVFRDTVRLKQAQAQLALLRDRIEVDAPVLSLPNSLLSLSGVMRSDSFPAWFDQEKAPMYDLAFRSDSVAFQDLLWLYPRFPEEMKGKLSLRIEHRPEGMMFLGRELDVRARGTHIVGDFGMIVGDTLRFVDVDLEADPIRTATVEQMLPEGLPVQGLVLGGIQILGQSAAPRRTRAEEEAEDDIAEAEQAEAPAPAPRPAPAVARPPVARPRTTPPPQVRPGVEPGSATEAEALERARARPPAPPQRP